MSHIKDRLKQYKDEYSKYGKYDGLYVADALEMLEQLQDDLEQDEKENGWIPCNERLPEIGQKILCQSKNRSGEIFVGIYRDKGKYKDSPYFDWKQNGFPSVISWMPLPEPYKKNNDAEY